MASLFFKLLHKIILFILYSVKIIINGERHEFVGAPYPKKTTDEAKNEPLLGGHLSSELNLFDQILP